MKSILTKEGIISAIQELPEDVRISEVVDNLFFLHKMGRGLNELPEYAISNEEIKRPLMEELAAKVKLSRNNT